MGKEGTEAGGKKDSFPPLRKWLLFPELSIQMPFV